MFESVDDDEIKTAMPQYRKKTIVVQNDRKVRESLIKQYQYYNVAKKAIILPSSESF